MDNTLGSVKKQVQSLIGDPLGDFTTDAYLTPLINIVYEAQTTQLMSEADSSFDDWVFDLPNVDIGTTSLANYQAMTMVNDDGTTTTGPLAGLVTPEVVEFKFAGQPDGCYKEAGRTGKLPNVSPSMPPAPYRMQWEWRGNVIYLTPLNFPADLRVRGEFSPPSVVKDTDAFVVHRRMGTAVSFGTAALIGAERGNNGWTTKYTPLADTILDNISNMLTKSEQGTTTRIGRVGGRGSWHSVLGGGF